MKVLCCWCFHVYPSDCPVREKRFLRQGRWEGQRESLPPFPSSVYFESRTGAAWPGESGCLPCCQTPLVPSTSVSQGTWLEQRHPVGSHPQWCCRVSETHSPSTDGVSWCPFTVLELFCKPLQILSWCKIGNILQIYFACAYTDTYILAYGLC